MQPKRVMNSPGETGMYAMKRVAMVLRATFFACCCLTKHWSIMTESRRFWYFLLCWKPLHDFCIIRAPHLSFCSCLNCFLARYCLTEHCMIMQALFDSWNSFFCWYPLQVAWISVAFFIIIVSLFCSKCFLQFFWINVAAQISCSFFCCLSW